MMSTTQTEASAISREQEYERRMRDMRRREGAIPLELIEASSDDIIVRRCIDLYMHGEINYVEFLEKLAIIQVEDRKRLLSQHLEFLNINALSPNIEREKP